MNKKTAGELAFEQYLRAAGISDFDHEPLVGQSKRPDYVLHHNEKQLIFELKDFKPSKPIVGPVFVDSDLLIRKKIEKAKEKFGKLRDQPLVPDADLQGAGAKE